MILGRYTRQGLWSLFLMCALPLHAWTLVLAFRDLSWLTDRTNSWDAIGVLCYGLLFAFVESVLVFLISALLGLITPRRWDSRRRVGFMSALVLVLSVWAMLEQLYFLADVRLPDAFLAFLVNSAHPLRVLYTVIPAIVIITFAIPVYLILRSERGVQVMTSIIDRLGLLASFYLVFDVAAVVVVVIRNV